VHLPWCVHKCPYCDFNSHEYSGDLPEAQYIDALIIDLEQAIDSAQGRSLTSIFIGGGTPSLFSAHAIDRLLSAIAATPLRNPEAEVTLEANPGTLEAGRFRDYRQAGVNRLSIGVQSFDDDLLQRLGRIHSSRQAIAAIESAQDAGFERINIDVMYGLPGQTAQQGESDIQQALALEPGHLSYYQLTLEPNTLFHHQPPALPTDELIGDIESNARSQLGQAGYQQYEVSAFSHPRQASLHNLNYWQFGDYIGIGAGAHAKLTFPERDEIQRYSRIRQPQAYLQASSTTVSDSNLVPDQDRLFEFMLNALRLRDGFSIELLSERTGLPTAEVASQLQSRLSQGLLAQSAPHHYRPTALGWRYLNDLQSSFLPNDPGLTAG